MQIAALVAAILEGETHRFAEVVERYDRRVRRVVGRMVSDPHGREEVVQQTFYLAFRRLGELEEPGSLEPWLARIAFRCSADHLRRRGRRAEEALGEEAETAAPERGSHWIWEEVERLPSASRQILALRYREGLAYREIAERLGLPLSTVRGRIYEARRALRRRLHEPGESTS